MKTACKLVLAFLVTAATANLHVCAAVLAPVRLKISDTSRTTSLHVTNDSKTSMTIDVRVMEWIDTTEIGVDVLQPTSRVMSSRPVMTIEPSQTAVIRFLVKERTDQAQDNYRVVVTDITPNETDKVALRLRHLIPLFIVNDKKAIGRLVLIDGEVKNTGTRHVRITNYRDTDGKNVQTLRYILPGKSVRLPVRSIEDVTYNDNLQ